MDNAAVAAANEQTIRRFYTAFAAGDYATMQDCYTDDIVFYDPVFGVLQGEQAKTMWEMLNKRRGADFSLEYEVLTIEEEYCTAKWTARYTFSGSGRKVVNHIKAHLRFRDGKICEHTDEFSFYKWCRQAFGWKGWLLGGTSFMQNRVRNSVRKLLTLYMEKKG